MILRKAIAAALVWSALFLALPSRAGAAAPADEPELVPLPAAPAAPRPAAPRWLKKGRLGTLLIRSETPLAVVRVDGLEVGTTPVKPMPIAPGKHEVRLSRPGYREASERVTVRAGKKARVTLTLEAVSGVLQIGSQVPGARVFVDGRAVGEAPLRDLELAPGARLIRLEAPGHEPLEQLLRVVAGGEYQLFGASQSPALPDLPSDVGPRVASRERAEPQPALSGNNRAPASRDARAPGAGAPLVSAPDTARPGAASATADPRPSGPALPELPPPPLVVADGAAAKAPVVAPARPVSAKPPVPMEALQAPPAAADSADTPLHKRWYVWGGVAAVAAVVAAGVVYALPPRYVERRDPAAACGGTCGVVVNK